MNREVVTVRHDILFTKFHKYFERIGCLGGGAGASAIRKWLDGYVYPVLSLWVEIPSKAFGSYLRSAQALLISTHMTVFSIPQPLAGASIAF